VSVRRGELVGAFGFQPGPRSRVTVLDIDPHDDTILAEALREHGETPLIVRTGGVGITPITGTLASRVVFVRTGTNP
jgi:hypothetical protein